MLLVGLGGSSAIWAMYRTGLSFLRSWWTLGLFLGMPLCFVFSNVFLNAVPRNLLRFLAWAGGLWMGFLYYSVLGALVFLAALLVGKLATGLFWYPGRPGCFLPVRCSWWRPAAGRPFTRWSGKWSM